MKKIIILSVAVAMTFASCQKSEVQSPEVGGSSQVVFTSAISTRVTDTAWDNDDEIGVFMYESDDSSIYDSDSENVLYTTSGGESGIFTSLDTLLYPLYSSVDFIAYHPYTTNYSDQKISLSTADQSTEAKVKAQDFMVASTQSCDVDNAPTLRFTRKMSKIVIAVTLNDSKVDAVLSYISLSNLIIDGTFSIVNDAINREDASVAAGATTADVSMFFNQTSSTIEAIIIPQEVSSTLTIVIDGEEFKATISGTFAEDTQYNYNLDIGTNKVNFSTSSITGWTEEECGDMPTTQM